MAAPGASAGSPISMNEHKLIDQSFEELQAQMDRCQRLVRCALDGCGADEADCLLGNCPHRRALVQLALHSVQVLDDTRKAFKSKQLEALRKHLLRVLTEQGHSDGVGSECCVSK
jgi:hypothetical protein